MKENMFLMVNNKPIIKLVNVAAQAVSKFIEI